MLLTEQSHRSVPVLAPKGRFDAHTVPEVRTWLNTTIERGDTRIVIDLSAVNFLDSAALAVLVHGLKHCRQHGGDLVLCGMQAPVRIIFELTRLDRAFSCWPEVESAVAFLRR